MGAEVEPHPDFEGIYQVRLEDGSRRIATENLVQGRNVYGERLIKQKDSEYRLWEPYRSKLAAAIFKGLKRLPIKIGNNVLYLGAASGTTVSHVSDIVGDAGHIYAVEFAPRSIRELIDNVCRYRYNISPVLADARFPERYVTLVQKVDVIYCDVAQPEQAQILVNNARVFLKKDGWIMLAIKSRSIDVTKEPAQIYEQETRILERNDFKVSQVINLEPYDKAHAMIVAHL